MQKLYHLWYVDSITRRRFQIATIAVAFLYGAVNGIALHRPEKQVSWETVGVVCFLTVAFSIFYCVREDFSQRLARHQSIHEAFLRNRFVLVPVLGLIFISAATQTETGRAGFLDLQLRLALLSPQGKGSAFAGSLIRNAADNQVRVNPKLVRLTASKLVDSSRTDPENWQNALALLSYHSTLNKQETPPFPHVTCIGMPEDTDGITAHVSNSVLTGCVQGLDHVEWKNVVFENVNIVYHGGPMTLENVQFKNCRFEMDYSLPSQRLGKSLIASNSVTITIRGHS